ncbi:MAG: translation elongation factor Ts, partial [Candidatus Omnitrophota bacterium]
MSVVASADTVKQLRERTGAGMMDCKAALVENGGDIEKAIDSLRKKGMAQAAKRAGREAKEGQIAARIEGKKAAVVEVNCETDFVARTEDFKQFAEMVLAETMVCGDGAVLSAAVTHRVAE